MDKTQGKILKKTVEQLLAILAHEIRNPLANLSNSLYLLEMAPQDASVVTDCTQVMRRQVKRIARLVEDLMQMAAIDQGKFALDREVSTVNNLLRLAHEDSTCQMEIKGHQVHLHPIDIELCIDVDTERLLQVFSNLLNNAAKYTPEGGRIDFGASVEGEEVVFYVKDNGIGIEPSKLGSIFDIYMQAQRVDSKVGLGIGLALVKRLVELHNGSVGAFSGGLGMGTTIFVRLPIHRRDGESRAGNSRRILIVEEDENSGKVAKRLLEMDGHDVQMTDDSERVIDMAHSFVPEIVLLGVGLSDHRVPTVTKQMRNIYPAACVVAISRRSSEVTMDCYDGRLPKSIESLNLLETLGRCDV